MDILELLLSQGEKEEALDAMVIISELEAERDRLLDELQDLEDELNSLKAFCRSEIRKMPPEYIKGKANE